MAREESMRFETHQRDVRSDEDDRRGEGHGDGGFEGVTATAKTPGGDGSEQEGEGGEDRGQAQGGEGWAGEVEEMRHGEGVVAHAAMRHERADVGDEGQMTRLPQSPGEQDRGGNANDHEEDLRAGEPTG